MWNPDLPEPSPGAAGVYGQFSLEPGWLTANDSRYIMNVTQCTWWSSVALLVAGTAIASHASSTRRLSLKEQCAEAEVICRVTVLAADSLRDAVTGTIKTETRVRVDESLKGVFPPVLRVWEEGGAVDGEGQLDGFSARLRPGEKRLLFLSRHQDGSLGAVHGFASALRLAAGNPESDATVTAVRTTVGKGASGPDVTDQQAPWNGPVPEAPVEANDATGLLVDNTGVPSRYLAPDRGEPIEYLVDSETLPTGLTLEECLDAATNAFAAWSAVTGITFKFAGLQNFGQASANVIINDQRIRVQFHDLYDYITSTATLGRGGRGYAISGSFPGGGMGGRVADQEFYPNNRGYVVLNHRASPMQLLTTFEEVLCHELGHALGLAHSSVNPAENNPLLREAMMYYLAHNDGRGALLGAYDPPVVQKVHPPANTPPFGYDRVLDVVTASPQPNVPGINSLSIEGYDRQGDPLTLTMTEESQLNGTFSLDGSLLRYAANFAFSDSGRADPASGQYRDTVLVRYSDGVNASPYVRVRVLSYNFDNQPTGASDGIPNSWAQQYFGSTVPSAAALSRAGDDRDGDGLTNLEEWLGGTDPTVASSRLVVSSFDGATIGFGVRPYDLYEVLSTTEFDGWNRDGNPVLPTETSASLPVSGGAAVARFFQVRRVP